jgi:hypothetical protein
MVGEEKTVKLKLIGKTLIKSAIGGAVAVLIVGLAAELILLEFSGIEMHKSYGIDFNKASETSYDYGENSGDFDDMYAQGQIEVNENGWLIGPQFDNRRISVNVGGVKQITVITSRGEPVVVVGNTVYKINLDGTAEEIGTTYTVGGDHDTKYYLRNGEYIFVGRASRAINAKPVAFRVDYYNDGYEEKSFIFENVECSSFKLFIEDYALQKTGCFVDKAPDEIAPTSVQGSKR